MPRPIATYRLQLGSGFGFAQAARHASYLRELGISDLYLSPIFAARPGSSHGYDVVDMTTVSSELGGRAGCEALSLELRRLELGWLQDIVPNHRAFHIDNPQLRDVLELGPHSRFYRFFDVLWDHRYESIQGKILAPFLGDFYARCLERGELALGYERGAFRIRYYDHAFPLSLRSYRTVLRRNLARHVGSDGASGLGRVAALVKFLDHLEDEIARRPDFDHAGFVKEILRELVETDAKVRAHVESNVRAFNGRGSEPGRWDLLDGLLGEQFFRLAFWKVGTEELNYRRFFSINDLISLRVEEERVFEHTHRLLFELARAGRIQGVRVDHVDGLYDPAQYLERLRARLPDLYIVVEKILHGDEELPLGWPVEGTTGYDFLDRVTALFCEPDSAELVDQSYRDFTGDEVAYEETVRGYKRLIVGRHMAGDIDNLALLLKSITNRSRDGNDLTMYAVRRALVELLSQFPVYRTYVSGREFSAADQKVFAEACARACETAPHFRSELELIASAIERVASGRMAEVERQDWVTFLMRLQQYTGPVMAKGVEDSAFYAFPRLLARNEVGCDPERVGWWLDDFHSFGRRRAARWPLALNTTATHDTKRGEDARARLAVLSWAPAEFGQRVARWNELNRRHKTPVGEELAPCRRDEYALYQTVLASAPFGGLTRDDFPARLAAYVVKAAREAKRETSWLNPSPSYEQALTLFARRIIDPEASGEFLTDFVPFLRRIALLGIFVSLGQTLLKLTFPGIPDLYQGTELWDLSMVDPDNRRPVDFEARAKLLAAIATAEQADPSRALDSLCASADDGRVKLWLLHRVLGVRHERAELFAQGRYEPLVATGVRAGHVVAFARMHGDDVAVTIVLRRVDELEPGADLRIDPGRWGDTVLRLPWSPDARWHDRLCGATHDATEPVPLGALLGRLPVALLTNWR